LRAKLCASVVAIFAASFSLTGCADNPLTNQHSFTETNTSFNETDRGAPRTASIPSRRVAIRGTIDEHEGKLSGVDEHAAGPRKADEIELVERVNPRIVRESRFLQCVRFVQEATGIDIRGNANRWWELAKGQYARSHRPEEGSILVMRGWRSDRRGHVAVVKEILDERTIVIDHANWLNDGRIYLNAPVRDESPKNDWSRVRVWYTPGETWGQRIYKAKGFIYPDRDVAQDGPGAVFALSR
jgi:surface antigen